MENHTTWQQKTEMVELLISEIKELQRHIDYHEKHLAEYKIKMQIAEYALRNITQLEYGTV